MKTYKIEVSGSELSLIIWGLHSLTHSNGGALIVTSIGGGDTETADSDTLAARMTAMEK